MHPGGTSRWRRYLPDLVIGTVLLVAALLLRGDGMPTDGVWLDDAIVGAGLSPPPSDLLAVSFDHPGYTVLMSAWSAIFGAGATSLAFPALIAGALGAPLLFAAMRALDYDRSVSVLIAAILVGAQAHVTYSGRLKTYVIDLLVVLAIAVVLPRLVGMRWGWRTGVLWFVGGVIVASFSSFCLVATMVAGAIVILAPSSDLRVRLVAVGAQGAASLALLLLELRTYDSGPIEEQWRDVWDAFPDVGLDVLEHLGRIGQTFPGGPGWVGGAAIAIALTGLVLMAWRGRDAIRARYLLLLLAAALLGGLLGKFPFGPQVGNPLSTGERATLWLIPVVAVGLVFALQAIRDATADRRPLRVGFDVLAYAGAVVVLIAAGPALSYPFPGPHTAAEYVDAELGPDDSLLLPYRSNWSFANESSTESEPRATPESSIGYVPEFADERIHDVASYVDGPPIDDAIEGAGRVFVYYPAQPFSDEEAQTRRRLGGYLLDRGLVPDVETFENASVEVWTRNEGNLVSTDVPAGWTLVPSAGESAVFECLSDVGDEASTTTVTALSPDSKNQVILSSALIRWPSTQAAEEARDALSRPGASSCVAAGLGTIFGDAASAEVRPVEPPPTAGLPAVAFEQALGGGLVSVGDVVAVSSGPRMLVVTGFRVGGEPFPPDLTARTVRTLSERLKAADG